MFKRKSFRPGSGNCDENDQTGSAGSAGSVLSGSGENGARRDAPVTPRITCAPGIPVVRIVTRLRDCEDVPMEASLAVLLVLGVGWIVSIDRIVRLIAKSYGYDA